MIRNLGKFSLGASLNGDTTIMPKADGSSSRGHATVASYEPEKVNRRHKIAADFGGSGSPSSLSGGAGGFGVTGGGVTGAYITGVVEKFLPETPALLRRIYRDMYHNDPVAGGAVDMLSSLPWSDFSLAGVPDADMVYPYTKSIDNMSMKTLHPELSVEYMVLGTHVSVLGFDSGSNVFTSIMPFDIESVNVTEVPIYGIDPLIDLKLPKSYQDSLNKKNDDKRWERVMKQVPGFMSEGKQGEIRLNPSNVLYIPRRTMSTMQTGTSYYRRLLSIYLFEKALLTGTIESAYRRQRGILHTTIGDEDWEPTDEEMKAIVNMVISADVDPTGAIIATRQGVSFEEIRNGEEFWKYTDIVEETSSLKFQALGINADLMNGSSNFNSLESAMSSFVENLRAFRDMITRKVYYNKIFPAIAYANNFQKTKKEKHQIMGRFKRHASGLIVCDGSNYAPDLSDVDLTDYHIPKVHWHKSLKPEADADYLEVLNTLEEKGVPIPLRLWAAVGGMNLTEALNSMEEDIILRKRVQQYNKMKPKTPQQEVHEMTSAMRGFTPRKGGFATRKYPEERLRDDDTGKQLSAKGRKIKLNKFHNTAARAMTSLAGRENKKTRTEQIDARTKSYSISGTSPYGATR